MLVLDDVLEKVINAERQRLLSHLPPSTQDHVKTAVRAHRTPR
ncbi:hypothetical protein [Streptomyces sp. NBC_00728]